MEIIETSIEGIVVLKPRIFKDERGYFMESYKESFFKNNFPDIRFIQNNESMSTHGVLRGLHFQMPPFQQTKLVRVIDGEVLDVAVDLRMNSPTFGRWESIILSCKNKKQLLIPKGFAHGFVVLSEKAIFSYKVDNPYSAEHESGIIYNDEELNIDWRINSNNLLVSKKDKLLSTFKNIKERI